MGYGVHKGMGMHEVWSTNYEVWNTHYEVWDIENTSTEEKRTDDCKM